MTWDAFIWFGISAIVLSAAASFSALFAKERSTTAVCLASLGTLMLTIFIAGLWLSLERPPLRTMGETRLWYSLFALLSGLFTYIVWHYRWILSFSTVLATVFIMINIFRPEIHDQTLMPALQSPWFIPHVTVYMFSYSLLGCAFIIAVAGLCGAGEKMLPSADTLVYIGLAFLTFGMLSGALWAKEAWGNYWSWDPKEVWALITWLSYLLYIHLRLVGRVSHRTLYILLILSFAFLQMCWWGLNYLPSAQDSIHMYNR